MVLRVLTVISLSLAALSAGAETYYWVDENGKRHYGDKVPPQESKRERKILNEKGYTVKTLSRQKTAEEIAAEQRAAEQAKEQAEAERQARIEQAKYDSILLTTYDDVEAIRKVRDDRVGLLDASIRLETETKSDNEALLAKQLEQAKPHEDKGKAVPAKLAQRIKETQTRIANNDKNIAELTRQRDEVKAKYDSDIERYEALQSPAN
ncbi:MAG: DUF4124 domain-containing protein [Nevskiales bacterium]